MRRTFSLHRFVGLMFLVGLWLLTRPYFGIRHDGILYSGQALARIHPQFGSDLFFAFGSQDKYSIFGFLQSQAIRLLGLADATIIMLLVSLFVFGVAATWLGRSLLSSRWTYVGLLALACFPHLFGAQQIFAFAEPFLTARSLAEPFALMGLVLVWRSHLAYASVAFLISAMFHPLIALPVIVTAWCFLCVHDRRWIWALSAIVPILGLAFSGIAPFSQLLISFEGSWLRYVNHANANVFLAHWELTDWNGALFDIAVLSVFVQYCSADQRSKVFALFGAIVLCIATSFIGADLFRNVLITELQLWRILWLVHFFALLVAPFSLYHLSRKGDLAECAAWLILSAGLTVSYFAPPVEIGLAALLLSQARSGKPAPSKKILTMLKGVAVVAACIAGGRTAVTMWREIGISGWGADILFIATIPVVSLGIAMVFIHATFRRRVTPYLTGFVAITVLITGTIFWDRRNAEMRFIEAGETSGRDIRSLLGGPSDGQVYLGGKPGAAALRITWFVLQRPSFYSSVQSAGLLFNRKTALEFARRDELFSIFDNQETVCKLMNALNNQHEPCVPRPELVVEICNQYQDLDIMIFDGPLDHWHATEFSLPTDGRPDRYFAYRCAEIRTNVSQPKPKESLTRLQGMNSASTIAGAEPYALSPTRYSEVSGEQSVIQHPSGV